MNCEQFEQLIDDFQQSTLDLTQNSHADEHLQTCQQCKLALLIHNDYKYQMHTFRAPEPKPGAIGKLMYKAREANKQHYNSQQHTFTQGFIAASILALILIAGLSLLNNIEPTPGAITQNAEKLSYQQVVVVINVPTNMPDASLALQIPDSIELDGFDGMSLVKWQVNLQRGANKLILPVVIKPGTDISQPLFIAATIGYKDQKKGFQLPLEFVTTKSSHDRQTTPINTDHTLPTTNA
jgi:hypothetical protein